MKRQIASVSVMAFALALSASTATAQNDGPRTFMMEGNWRVTWNNFPEGAPRPRGSACGASTATCTKTVRGDCLFLSEAEPGTPWQLSGTWQDEQRVADYFAPQSLAVDSFAGTMSAKHAYGALGHWGGTEEVISVDRDAMTGAWTYNDATGTSRWERVEPVLHSVFTQGKTTTTIGRTPNIPVRLGWDAKTWAATNEMRGNRPKITLVLRGDELWGNHRAYFPSSPGFEVHTISPVYSRDPATGRDTVVGQRLEIVLWPGAEPGVHPLVVDSLTIPLDLTIDRFPMNSCQQLEALIADLKKISAALAGGVMSPQLAAQFGQWIGAFHRDVSSRGATAEGFFEGTVSSLLLGAFTGILSTGDVVATLSPAAWGPGALLGFWYFIGKETTMQAANWMDADRNTAFHEYILTAVEYPSRPRAMGEKAVDFLDLHRKEIETLTGQPLPKTGKGYSEQQLRTYLDRHALGLLYYFGLFEETAGSAKFPRHKLNVQGSYGGQRYAADYWRRVMAAELKPKIAALEQELAAARRKLCP